MRADRRRLAAADPGQDHAAAGRAGADLGRHLRFTLSWNEFIYALTFISSSENKTVPVGVITELVEGDVYHWGSLMAGALMGSLPVAILYSFFVEHYVSSMTGAVKE
jgi:ABC-type glycerol-3-phosphate transport system permease component